MWNDTYENLLKFIEKYDKEYLMLFNSDTYACTARKTVELIKDLYKNNLSLSFIEFKTFVNNVKINNTPKITISTVTYNYNEINLLNKELELKIHYSKLKKRLQKIKNKK